MTTIDVTIEEAEIIDVELTEEVIEVELLAAGPQGPAGQGVATGGTSGQVLRKQSGSDYDTGWSSLGKADVGLSNVDNTSDTAKPVSTAQAAAIAPKADKSYVDTQDAGVASSAASALAGHTSRTDNPHSVTKAQVGLPNVDNTSDASKPVSTAQGAAIAAKYSKPGTGIPKTDLESAVQTSLGKADSALQTAPVTTVNSKAGAVVLNPDDLSDASSINKFTTAAEKAKLAGIAAAATANSTDAQLRDRSTHTGSQTAATISDFSTAANSALSSALALKAPMASPAFTGTPTTPSVSAGDNSTKVANTAYVDAAAAVATSPDASTSTKGRVQLANDLAGTAAAPIVKNATKVFYVKDYLAVADGTTNDGPSINNAIAAAAAIVNSLASPAIVQLMVGVHKHSVTINTSYNNITLRGYGRAATSLLAASGIVQINAGNGDPTVGSQISGLRFEDFTLDGGNFGSSMFNMTLGSVKDVTIENVHFKNLGSGAHAWLFAGVSTNASSAMVSRTLRINNCVFSDSQAGWEGLTLSQMLDVKITNTVFRDKPNGFGLLNYGSHDVVVIGCEFIRCKTGLNGFGMTNFVGCTFQGSQVTAQAFNSTFLGCTWDNVGTSDVNGITFLGYTQSGSESFWDALPAGTNVALKNNKVISCTFRNSNSVAIRAGVFIGTDTNSYLSCDDLKIVDCSFESSLWQGIDVKANYLVVRDCDSYNNGQLGTSAVKFNYVIAGKKVTFHNNRSYDNQLTPTATRDYFIDNTYAATLIPTMEISLFANTLEIGGSPYYYDGSTFSSTKPSNITLKTNMTSSLDMGGNKVSNVANGTSSTDAVNMGQLTTATAPVDATTASKGVVQLAGDLAGTAASPTVPGLATKANDAAVVHQAGAEIIPGVKTFSSTSSGGAAIFGDGTNGYIKLGDALLRKLAGNYFSFLNNGIQGISNLTVGQDNPKTNRNGYFGSTSTTNPTVEIQAIASQVAALQYWSSSSAVKSAVWPDGSLGIGTGTTAPTSTFQVVGSFATAVITKTANFTFDATMNEVLIDASGGTVTGTLPSANNCLGRAYVAHGWDATNSITIAVSGSDKLKRRKSDTNTTDTLITGDVLKYVAHTDGTNFFWVVTT